METTHRFIAGDSRRMAEIDDGSVELVVTSPPYPMIEMWDDTFASLNGDIGKHLASGNSDRAFALMHDELSSTWKEVARVLVDGGIVCVNVGDTTRTFNGGFEMFPNHVKVIEWFRENGFRVLPDILWRKPTNSAAKFMGSGMLPPNAYVTLEHEYLLIFRKGEPRSFEPGADRRYGSAYFWEERNEWFSDVWEGITGERQTLSDDDLRARSGAFPFAVPYRLINMYSLYGDTVLDPFWGTGTTSVAAITGARNSIGYEREPEFIEAFDERLERVASLSRSVVQDRLRRHENFVTDRQDAGNEVSYEATNYDVPVVTKQEQAIRFFSVSNLRRGDQVVTVEHEPFETSR